MTLRLAVGFPRISLDLVREFSLYPVVSTPERAKAVFFSEEMPLETVAGYQAQMGDESFRMLADTMGLDLPTPFTPQCPVYVLGGLRDTVFTVRELQQTARAYGAQAAFLDMAHDMMLEPNWQVAANAILAWLDEQGL